MVFIGLCGLHYTGKRAFALHLRDQFNFTIVAVNSSSDEADEGRQEDEMRCFRSTDELLDWATERWQEDLVWPGIESAQDYELISKRPFFLLIQLKSSMRNRLQRSGSIENLNGLVGADDVMTFRKDGLISFSPRASFTFLNNGTLTQLHAAIASLGLDYSPSKMALCRPDWDTYFMAIADFAAKRTNCMKRGVGAVLVQDMRIVATGYNGTARGVKNCLDGGCARCNCNTKCGHQLDSCLCLHAEENALLEASRSRSLGSTMYCTMAPCLGCAKKICQMGVRRVVFHQNYSVEHFTERLLKEAGIELDRFTGNIRQVVLNCEDFSLELDNFKKLALSD